MTRRAWRCPRPATSTRGALAVAGPAAGVMLTRIPTRGAAARAPPGRVSPCLFVPAGVLKTGMSHVGYISKHLTNT